jgi:hypothetical protein
LAIAWLAIADVAVAECLKGIVFRTLRFKDVFETFGLCARNAIHPHPALTASRRVHGYCYQFRYAVAR